MSRQERVPPNAKAPGQYWQGMTVIEKYRIRTRQFGFLFNILLVPLLGALAFYLFVYLASFGLFASFL
jgi:hypothetical protein